MLMPFKNTFIKRRLTRISLLALGLFYTQMVAAQVPGNQNLNGYYKGDNGGHYYVRTEGNLIYWFAEDQKGDWAHVFVGSLTQAGFEGEHFDVPKGRSNNSGRHSFRINSSARSFTRLSGSGSLGTATQAALPTGGLPEDRCVGGQESTIANITGCWDGGDGGKYYMSQRTIPGRGELVVWYGEQSNTNGRPLFSNIAFGTRSGNNIALDWVSVPKGTASGQGTLRLNIDNAGTITQLSQTGGFGATKWTRGGESAQVVDEQNILTKIIPKILSEIKIPQERSNQRKKEQEQAKQREQELAKQREQELARQREQELAKQREQELAKQREQELAKQREQELAKQREQELAKQRERELARQREQELARQREQELARQREQELAKQREQELANQSGQATVKVNNANNSKKPGEAYYFIAKHAQGEQNIVLHDSALRYYINNNSELSYMVTMIYDGRNTVFKKENLLSFGENYFDIDLTSLKLSPDRVYQLRLIYENADQNFVNLIIKK